MIGASYSTYQQTTAQDHASLMRHELPDMWQKQKALAEAWWASQTSGLLSDQIYNALHHLSRQSRSNQLCMVATNSTTRLILPRSDHCKMSVPADSSDKKGEWEQAESEMVQS